jgi:hypothetical protein
MCEIYHCTPKQWREDFSLYERRVFWLIQQMKNAKANQDAADSKHPEGSRVISRA